MTKQQLRNHCARQIEAEGKKAVLFMDKKHRDLYAGLFYSAEPHCFHLALSRSANSSTPVTHIVTFNKM